MSTEEEWPNKTEFKGKLNNDNVLLRYQLSPQGDFNKLLSDIIRLYHNVKQNQSKFSYMTCYGRFF